MKLFISWSGNVSQQIAQEIREWLPLILPAVDPFITTTDIEKGARWQGEISRELEESNYGIVCLTAQNLQSQWLAFEAGALSKQLAGRVATILFGIAHNDVQQPLSMFQGTLFNEQDVRQLLININAAAPPEHRREDAQIDKLFPMLWPDLQNAIDLIIQAAAQAPQDQPAGPPLDELAAEMLALLRQQNSVLSSPERFLSPVIDRLDAVLPPTRMADGVRIRQRVAPARRPWQQGVIPDGLETAIPEGQAIPDGDERDATEPV